MYTPIITLRSVLICIAVFTNILLAQDSAEVVIPSPRVGEVIDSVEREYYNLFKTTKKYSSAIIVKLPDEKFEARITTITSIGNEITSVKMSESLVYMLAEKIENYEAIKEGTYILGMHHPAIQIGTKTVEKEYVPKQNVEANKVIITAHNGDQYTGKILYVTDSLLMVWRSLQPYDSQKLNDFVVLLHSSKIERIVLEKKGQIWSGLLIGGSLGIILSMTVGNDEKGIFGGLISGLKKLAVIIGCALGGGQIGLLFSTNDDFNIGGDSLKYKAVVPTLKEKAIFPFSMPPELQTLQ